MTEDQIQRAVVQNYRARGAPGVFMASIPNGGYRRKTEAAILKGTGVVAGVPDTFWIREGRISFLEIKKPDGKLSPAQIRTLEQLEAAGAICEVAYGLDSALKWLEQRGLLMGRVV